MSRPDYADDLTATERAILEELLLHVRAPQSRAAGSAVIELSGGRRRWGKRAPLAAAAAVLVLIGGIGGIAGLRGWAEPVPAPLAAPTTVAAALDLADVWSVLASAASRAPAIDASIRETWEISQFGTSERCAAQVVSIRLTTDRAAWPRPLAGTVTASLRLPAGGPGVTAGPCTEPPVLARQAPTKPVFSDASADLAARWPALSDRMPDGVVLPPFVDPRLVGNRLPVAKVPTDPATLNELLLSLIPRAELTAIGGSSAGAIEGRPASSTSSAAATPAGNLAAARWWRNWVELVSSPLASDAQRAAALAAADLYGPGAVVLRPEATADACGRSGLTVRVPYEASGVAAVADLTFDASTGRLLQRTVRIGNAMPKIGLLVTVFSPPR